MKMKAYSEISASKSSSTALARLLLSDFGICGSETLFLALDFDADIFSRKLSSENQRLYVCERESGGNFWEFKMDSTSYEYLCFCLARNWVDGWWTSSVPNEFFLLLFAFSLLLVTCHIFFTHQFDWFLNLNRINLIKFFKYQLRYG